MSLKATLKVSRVANSRRILILRVETRFYFTYFLVVLIKPANESRVFDFTGKSWEIYTILSKATLYTRGVKIEEVRTLT